MFPPRHTFTGPSIFFRANYVCLSFDGTVGGRAPPSSRGVWSQDLTVAVDRKNKGFQAFQA